MTPRHLGSVRRPRAYGRLVSATVGLALALIGAPPARAHDEIVPPPPPLRDRPIVHQLHLQVTDSLGVPIGARVHVRDSSGQDCPGTLDPALLSHYGGGWTRGYWYADGGATVEVAPGVVTIHAGRGVEWRPVTLTPVVTSDTTITIALDREFDLRAEGWFGGDVHTHSRHAPIEYTLAPLDMLRIAEAEDLSMLWILDQWEGFTGGPHPLSTDATILYYSTEWRNQAYGHAPLLGLTELVGTGCCAAPSAAYPTLSGVREEWEPGYGQAMVLAHPHTTDDFFYDGGWPGWGLGRELPVMATSGNLDALDLASYSNEGYVQLGDWQSLLSCGILVPPSAGTDAVVNRFASPPPGAYRVYVREDGPHTAAGWVEGLKAGRGFVTNYPLITTFTVDGVEAGTRLDLPGPTATVEVQVRVRSTLPPTRVILLRNGETEKTWTIGPNPLQTEWDLATPVTLSQSSWLAVRVEGTTLSRHAITSNLFAVSGAVFAQLDGAPPRSTADAGRMIDWVDSLETFVEARGNWPSNAAHDEVLQRLETARQAFAAAFVVAPEPFELLVPAESETLEADLPALFDWTDAVDVEPGDRVGYWLSFAEDTTLAGGLPHGPFEESTITWEDLPLRAGRTYWWRVAAVDRGSNLTISTPSWRRFFYRVDPASGIEPIEPGTTPSIGGQIAARPNPTTGRVRLEARGADSSRPSDAAHAGAVSVSPAARFEVYDISGRLLVRLAVDATGGATWDGHDELGRPVPAGVYGIRYRPTDDAGAPIRPGRVLVLR